MPQTVIVDVDGTVALREGPNARGPFEYHRVLEDTPNRPVIAVIEALAQVGHEIVFLSGREAVPGCYEDTRDWIREHTALSEFELYLRAVGDHRKDFRVKKELYRRHLADRDVLCVLDDRDQVVRFWREDLGFTCLQVAYGNF